MFGVFLAARLEVVKIEVKLQIRDNLIPFYRLGIIKYAFFVKWADDMNVPALNKFLQIQPLTQF